MCRSRRNALSFRRLVCVALLMGGCDGDTVGLLASCIPFDIPGLNTDGGPTTVDNLSTEPFDAAGFFDDVDGGLGGPEEPCGATRGCKPGLGLDCVAVTQGVGLCLGRCGGGDVCSAGRVCRAMGSDKYCVETVQRGEGCEVTACAADAGLACLPARSESGRVLAWTCQLPCDPMGGGCSGAERCLPVVTQVGTGGGSCPCPNGQHCVAGACQVTSHVCGQVAPLGDPTRLDNPVDWTDAEVCDPGVGQRFCGQATDGGAPLFCAQGNAFARAGPGGLSFPGTRGLCMALCLDPQTGAAQACPPGAQCDLNLRRVVYVPAEDAVCTADVDCASGAGQFCAGPLPAYSLEYRCALPYGLCVPPPAPDAGMPDGGAGGDGGIPDGGPTDASTTDGG